MGDTGTATSFTQVFSGRYLERGWIHGECANDVHFFPFFNHPVRKSFKRLPTTTEWARFRKYARRMRELEEYGDPKTLPLEALSVLQLCNTNEPLLPNLKTLFLSGIHGLLIPFIPLFLSLRVTSISLAFSPSIPKAMVISVVTTVRTLCPNLQTIDLRFLPRDPMITAAVSEMVLATSRNGLRKLAVACPLTEEASEVIYKLPNLHSLSVNIRGETPLSSASLPNLTELKITCANEVNWPRLFQRATFGKLESVTFHCGSGEIGDFLGTFERAALSSSVQNTLSVFHLSRPYLWNPNYSSLLPFTQLVNLVVQFSCDYGCSSTVDDDIIISLSRAMPKLRALRLGGGPCREFAIGATAKGLMALALHCPDLLYLCIHFQVVSLSTPLASPGRKTEHSGSWAGCALREIVVGETVVPEESVSTVALTLLQIFPRVENIDSDEEGWEKVKDAIYTSRRIIDCTSKHNSLTTP